MRVNDNHPHANRVKNLITHWLAWFNQHRKDRAWQQYMVEQDRQLQENLARHRREWGERVVRLDEEQLL
jgi:hypothetical protein